MINKTNLKFYLIPVGFLLLVFLIILIVPMGNKKTNEQPTIPTPTPLTTQAAPTLFKISTPLPSVNPTNGPTPTLIPLRFTGADLSQDVPPDVKLFSQQKTELRRKAPLELAFGTVSFDYENDKFILTLKEPKDQSTTTFNTWRQQTYPSIPTEQFAIQ